MGKKVILTITYPDIASPFIEYYDEEIEELIDAIDHIVHDPGNYREDAEEIKKILKENGIDVEVVFDTIQVHCCYVTYVDFIKQ